MIVKDPQLEYFHKPGAYHRFGNRLSFNSFCMRSDEPPSARKARGPIVLVLGDSVVNGGPRIYQSELATEILKGRLGRGSFVGNVSAGSWGPVNLSVWIARSGLLSADDIFVVVSSHDLNDIPIHSQTLGTQFRQAKPVLATITLTAN